MPKKRRKLTLSEKKSILAIITVGCSRETAARYVGCSTALIRREIAGDANFATQMLKAAEESEIFFINKIRNAADKEQYWRAAAWALERRCPNRYAPRGAGTLSMDQVKALISRFTDIVMQEIPGKTERRNLLKRIHALVKENIMEESATSTDLPEDEDE